ncbi:hypothetical protein OH76DRAFT_1352685 [Lentinus brumalis]|uniref:Uncharacterized protein n=1 Tax=Lentinus brumalis TaxID=2498619 RepID=A0A371D6Y1_9APHY|nr:hypothetical protein OH76DRAFT_1352685 [Polyporus brumalis]
MDPAHVQGTPELYYQAQQEAYERYWRQLGLRMNHSQPPTPGGSSHAQQHGQASVLAIAYYDLPQRDYVAKRRFQPKSPILFRTQTTEYIRLFDALQGTLHGLLGPDDAVFSGDNLSQKQSIRLEIVGCPSFERQINVRNPANNGKSITRAKVAEKIAKEIADYMKRHTVPLGEPSLGLGPGMQGYERIVLIGLRHVSMSSWQPILGLIPT